MPTFIGPNGEIIDADSIRARLSQEAQDRLDKLIAGLRPETGTGDQPRATLALGGMVSGHAAGDIIHAAANTGCHHPRAGDTATDRAILERINQSNARVNGNASGPSQHAAP